MMALKGNDMLQTLSLRHNKLCTATASAMGEILLQNTGLKNIDLSWNALGPAAGASLAKGLSHNLTLQVCCCAALTPVHGDQGTTVWLLLDSMW